MKLKREKKNTASDSLRWNSFFIIMLCAVFVFGMAGLFGQEKTQSSAENRTLNKFEHFTVKSFLNGSFQSGFENAMSDQFLKSEEIRIGYGNTIAKLPDFWIGNLICSKHYLALPGNKSGRFKTFDCGDYIIRTPTNPSKKELTNLKSNIARMNHVNELAETYYYVINTPATLNFEKNERIIDYKQVLSERLKGEYKISSFKYDNYDQYKQYFYKTDHHWNYLGSRKGFLDIAELLGIENPAEPINVFTSQGEYYFGPSAKTVLKFDSFEEFSVYKYNIPEHKTMVDGVEQDYNHIDDFIEHNYEYTELYPFYANVYGGSRGEVFFDFNQPDKPNLLMVVDSFSNPIKELIAQYYNKTYAVDLRHYEKKMGKAFVLSEYLKKNKIDKVLFIMSSEYFLLEGDTTGGLES